MAAVAGCVVFQAKDGIRALTVTGVQTCALPIFEEIIRRAPSLLTSRDRAVTRTDFTVIATEASGEVARAACDGRIGEDRKSVVQGKREDIGGRRTIKKKPSESPRDCDEVVLQGW